MRRIILILFLWPVFCISPSADVIDLIKQGKLDEARREVAAASTATRRDGTILYYQALLEQDGAKSFQFLEAAFKAEIDPRFMEDDLYLMALYYMADGNMSRVASTAEAYLQSWESGRFRSEMQRLAAAAYARLDREESAKTMLNRLIKENDGKQQGYAGKLDQAYMAYRKKNYVEAQNICRKLRQTEFDDIAAPSLYMLSFYAIEQKRIDDAILYYNILREGFPHAVGRDDLIDRFGNFENVGNDRRAEEMTGTVYSVQVGVFSQRENAKNLAERMKQYGEKVEISDKIISEKKYYVVYVGRFGSSQEALSFKSRLELSENEAFQVVAR
ncbi:MAG: SPOR domain-containing protein [Candidatus Zixiibacteriota bacterium]